ncbi:MAG TPA: hypothetical protein VMT11_13370 [Myxococcaceae bacterium]|nr:hypothetical protein [Myxococcaceae bacterium]
MASARRPTGAVNPLDAEVFCTADGRRPPIRHDARRDAIPPAAAGVFFLKRLRWRSRRPPVRGPPHRGWRSATAEGDRQVGAGLGYDGTVQIALLGLAGLMIYAGVMHFVSPGVFVRIVPRWLPAPGALVAISGACEILGGVGLLFPGTRRWAAWGLVALFIAVFPANVNMALNHLSFGRHPVPTWALWARLPLQAVLIAWAWSFTRPWSGGTPG